MTFLIDTNFFIQAHRFYYPLDVVPSFWLKICDLARESKIVSIDKVKDEIYQNQDALQTWCESNLDDNFFKSSAIAINEYASIAQWAISKSYQYTSPALAEFLDADEADAWLVAFALNHNMKLVTNEVAAPNSRKKIKIPDVCNQFDVKYYTPIEMFRLLGETF